MKADRARPHYGPEEGYFPLDGVEERCRRVRTFAHCHRLPYRCLRDASAAIGVNVMLPGSLYCMTNTRVTKCPVSHNAIAYNDVQLTTGTREYQDPLKSRGAYHRSNLLPCCLKPILRRFVNVCRHACVWI